MEVKTAQPEPTPPSPAGRLLLRGGGAQTFPELLDRYVRAHGERVFLPRRRARVVEPVTFRRLCTDVEQIAAGLLALGVERGDRVGLIADNRYEWLLADLGTTWFGGVDVPRGSDTPPAELVLSCGTRAAARCSSKTIASRRWCWRAAPNCRPCST